MLTLKQYLECSGYKVVGKSFEEMRDIKWSVLEEYGRYCNATAYDMQGLIHNIDLDFSKEELSEATL